MVTKKSINDLNRLQTQPYTFPGLSVAVFVYEFYLAIYYISNYISFYTSICITYLLFLIYIFDSMYIFSMPTYISLYLFI